MNLVVMGSSAFVVPIFESLRHNHSIIEAYTREPKILGRKKVLTKTPVHEWAEQNHIKVRTDIHDFNGICVDYVVVASYGVIIPDDILAKANFLNVHPSDLPKYRGPSPIRTAIRNGDSHSAVCITNMVHKVDAGDIYIKKGFDIGPDDTNDIIQAKVGKIASLLLSRFLDNPTNYPPMPQVGEVLMTKRTTLEDKVCDLSMPPNEIHNRVRAYGYVLMELGGVQVKVLQTKIEDAKLKILRVQPCGKKEMSWKDFCNGHRELKSLQ